ncbi:MAG: aldehyde ferredoxin oxidoreductase family protein [Anaerolineae bacterium]
MRTKVVDLATGKVETFPVTEETQLQYVGGLGLAAKLMFDSYRLGWEPLQESSPLIVAVGPLNATGLPGANRVVFYGHSPLTGLMAGTWMGGRFGNALARTGTTAYALVNRASKPSILLVADEQIEVLPRPHLWGLTVSEARESLRADYPLHQVAVIAPAGENKVPMACIRGDEGHAAGRCGLGAVMGSKNLKALVVRGTRRPTVARPDELTALIRSAVEALRGNEELMERQGRIGTVEVVEPVNEFRGWPTANHQRRYFEHGDKLYGERILQEYVTRSTTCPHCPVRCRKHVTIDGREMEAPEYESVWAFGPENLVDDYALIARASALCNEYGLDTISAGNAISFYREHLDGFASPEIVLPLIEKIARREDEGDLLANGVREAQKRLGVDFGMHVKGLELSAYDPRAFLGMALSYSTNNRGGCHSRAWTVRPEVFGTEFTPDQLAAMVQDRQDSGSVRDSLIICVFLHATLGYKVYAPALRSVTGLDYTVSSLKEAGERIFQLERLMNVRLGVSSQHDMLPDRILAGMDDLEKHLESKRIYYQLRSWTEEGAASKGKLAALGLSA